LYEYEAAIPIYALSFSNRVFVDQNRDLSILMGVGSYLPAFNKVQILRMNERHGIVKELEIAETWPISKILWLPKSSEGLQPEVDFLCTSSDWLRLYPLRRDENDGVY